MLYAGFPENPFGSGGQPEMTVVKEEEEIVQEEVSLGALNLVHLLDMSVKGRLVVGGCPVPPQ